MKYIVLLTLTVLITGCQINYLAKTAYNHLSMMSRREKIEVLLTHSSLDMQTRHKLELALKARQFAIEKIHLKKTSNYTSYIDVGRPYVSWVISAAPAWKLEHYEWSYPVVGKMPYKGFASQEDSLDEQKQLEQQGLDLFTRGVSAYSTLGWFEDSVLSTMLGYSDQDLVNTIIHEMVHSTIYIKDNADFNERLAVFVGNEASRQFYLEQEGPSSTTAALISSESHDDRLFSSFISQQLEDLKQWYLQLKPEEQKIELKQQRFAKLKEDFKQKVQPHLKTKTYERFLTQELNNAKILYYKTYLQDLSFFEQTFIASGKDWEVFFRKIQERQTSQ